MEDFLCCEDGLEHHFGLYHPYAFITAVIMMAVPLYWLLKHPQFLTINLTILFAANLRMHAIGDFKFFQRVHSWYAFSSLFSLWNQVLRPKPSSEMICGLVLLCWGLLQVYLAHSVSWKTEHSIEQVFEGICHIVIVIASGQQSYRVGLWRWYLMNCGLLLGIGATVVIEPHVCHVPVLNRAYHMFVDHGMVATMFYNVTAHMFELIKKTETIKTKKNEPQD